MLEAYSIKRQRIVKATESDYQDFYGYLICPECDDVLFLRKAHVRDGVEIKASFVHFTQNDLTTECKNRIKARKQENIRKSKYKSRQQQIKKLSLSLWKHLKTNKDVDLKYWDVYFKAAMYKKESFKKITDHLDGLANQLTIDDLWIAFDASLSSTKNFKGDTSKWLNSMCLADFYRHTNISWDLFNLLMFNRNFKDLRLRIYSVLLHPEHLEAVGLIGGNINRPDFNQKVLAYIVSSFVLAVATVDWKKILEQK